MDPKSEAVLAALKKDYPSARCALIFHNSFECLVAILLSAQATDRSVNAVTPVLFAHFPDAESLAGASLEAIENIIRPIGIFRHKAVALKRLSQILEQQYHGQVPMDEKALVSLPGVGSKTARVFLLERAAMPFIPVDTHLKRIAMRLGYAASKDSPLQIEKRLETHFPKEEWGFIHHALIAFGRDKCQAKKPQCCRCRLNSYCCYFKKNSLTIAK